MTSRSSLARTLALPVAAVLAVGLLAGCSDDGAAAGATDTGAGPAVSQFADVSALTVSSDGLEVSYDGIVGMTALELLLKLDPTAATTGEGEQAFVTTIADRTADAAKNEFWAFYVNGEMASVGAGSYVMEDGDVITWKLETF